MAQSVDKSEKREKKRKKKKNGMVVDNKSIFTIVSTIGKKQKKTNGGE